MFFKDAAEIKFVLVADLMSDFPQFAACLGHQFFRIGYADVCDIFSYALPV